MHGLEIGFLEERERSLFMDGGWCKRADVKFESMQLRLAEGRGFQCKNFEVV